MKKLKSIDIEEEYRSGTHDVLKDFLIPCISSATHYYRSVGYFSSSAFEAIGEGLGKFVSSGGRMRLITSVEMREADYEAIVAGSSKRVLCEEKIMSIIQRSFGDQIGDGCAALLELISIGRLEVKIALPRKGDGIFHEKLGIMIDDQGDMVAFSGSMNESRRGFQENFECIDVYTSWDSESRVKTKLENFKRLWDGSDLGAEVFDFPEAAKKALIKIYNSDQGGRRKRPEDDDVVDWSHQEKAAEVFLKKKAGVLEMATGTGKTRTALNIMANLISSGRVGSVIVCTDGNDLLAQWEKAIFPILGKTSKRLAIYKQFSAHKELNRFLMDTENAVLICARAYLAKVLKKIPQDLLADTLLILDEVHGLGSPRLKTELQGMQCQCGWRLGLSATPNRDYDEEGNIFIENFVGPVIFEFPLEAAIAAGILCPFKYVPIEYDLTEGDRARLQQVYKKKAARAAEGNPMSDEEIWRDLALVYKTAEIKPVLLDTFLWENPAALARSMVFVETQEYGLQVAQIIQKYRRDYHTYFGGEDSGVLQRFSTGELDVLISCHRLSEGIDIQSTASVILLSSNRGRRETIQRIGRCLRRDPDNPGKIALVVDFIRTDDDSGRNPDRERSEWLSAVAKTRRVKSC